ncbi:LysR family transcriptional regulator [Achromobacter xylosoxidans]
MDWDGARLGNRLKPRHLRLLADIARLGSLTRVAAAAGISQPTVTKALAELEDIFGAPLFERTGRGLRPTPLGELALLRAGACAMTWNYGRARSRRCTRDARPICRWARCPMCRRPC